MTTDRRKDEPQAPAGAKGRAREARLAAALRENLRRRKRQKSARAATAPPPVRDGRRQQRGRLTRAQGRGTATVTASVTA